MVEIYRELPSILDLRRTYLSTHFAAAVAAQHSHCITMRTSNNNNDNDQPEYPDIGVCRQQTIWTSNLNCLYAVFSVHVALWENNGCLSFGMRRWWRWQWQRYWRSPYAIHEPNWCKLCTYKRRNRCCPFDSWRFMHHASAHILRSKHFTFVCSSIL